VAALILIKAPNLLPAGLQLMGAFSILLSSAYQFSQVDAKTDEQSFFFKGFPSVWNFLVIYMMLLGLNPWINLILLVICNILVFVPVKYLYPSRNTRLRRLTLGLTYLYGAIGVWALLQYPSVPQWVVWFSLVYVAYYGLLSFFPKIGSVKPA
jgi:phosphatidylcholine synthase